MKRVAASPKMGVASFWIDPQPLSRAEYQVCVEAGACAAPEGCAPAEGDLCVSWAKADAFCKWAGKRLPLEAEGRLAFAGAAALGLEGPPDDDLEWTGSFLCADHVPGGCGNSRVTLRAGGHESHDRPDTASHPFRCAWSVSAPKVGPEPAPLIPEPTTTPNRIHCQNVMCDLATEVCCADESAAAGKCVPKPKGGIWKACEELLSPEECDEASDCPSGQHCCVMYPNAGAPAKYCSANRCGGGDHGAEVCLRGGTCKPGFDCLPQRWGPSECTWGYHGATTSCGGRTCSGSAPFCCWDAETKRGTCSTATGCEGEALYQCTKPADCGGLYCAGSVGMTRSVHRCQGPSSYLGDVLCTTLADCTLRSPDVPAYACLSLPGLPTGAKACVYPEHCNKVADCPRDALGRKATGCTVPPGATTSYCTYSPSKP